MKKLYYLLVVPLILIGCNESALHLPSNVSNVRARADTGGVTVFWNIPSDSGYVYVKVSAKKYPNDPDSNQVISRKASIFADSALIKGLLNKYKYTFKVQTFNSNPNNKKGGEVLTTDAIRPIRRPIKTDYFPNSLTQIKIDTSMISARSNDTDAGHVVTNLIDGNPDTYWQTSWNHDPHDPPFIVQVDFPQKESIGAIKYSNGGDGYNFRGLPTQIAVAISKDGNSWKQIWKSKPDLPTDANSIYSFHFDKNYTTKHFRFLILDTESHGTYAQFRSLSLYKMKTESVDGEKKAEENY
jgi:hypothetical protein